MKYHKGTAENTASQKLRTIIIQPPSSLTQSSQKTQNGPIGTPITRISRIFVHPMQSEEMTDEANHILSKFEVRMRDLMAYCDNQRQQIEQLNQALSQMNEALDTAQKELNQWQTNYQNLLTARTLGPTEEGRKDIKLRITRLIRQVDACIDMVQQNSE